MDDETIAIGSRLAEGLGQLAAGAVRVAAEGLATLPAEHRQRIQRAIDNGEASITVQCDLPTATVRVLVDGPGWASPQVLFATELRDPVSANTH